ncbi:MAG: hypothetical protein OXM56_04910 [Gammaproteobacteria bacterium]|nr:hypothetical protein [Gammaproteobacteria bacterium]
MTARGEPSAGEREGRAPRKREPDPVIDDIGRRVADAGSIERAAVVPGLFVAWCVNLGLISETVARDEARAVVRLKVREIGGAEFLVSACGGVLDDRVLSEVGLDFARGHYAAYREFAEASLPTPVEDTWGNYDRVAPWLTARYMGRARRRRRFDWRPWKWRK